MPGSFTSLLIIQILIAVLVKLLVAQNTSSCSYEKILEPGQTYYINNPGYPNKYRGANECTWDMYVDPGITALFNCSVNLYRSGRSCKDFVTVEGATSDSRYCTDFYTESSGQIIRVLFRSVARSEGGRFRCTVSTRADNCDCGRTSMARIVGGTEAGVNEFPMMVSLIDAVNRESFCGATIISQTWVVTAAHCLDTRTPQTTGVVVGEHDLRTGKETNATVLFRASRFEIHPDYSRTKNDIGLVQVAGTIKFSARVGPVCLPFRRPRIPEKGEMLTVLGWGLTEFAGSKAEVLMKVDLNVIPIKRCQLAYDNRSVSSAGQFCTYTSGKDSCQMDGGGPLLSSNEPTSRYFLAGLVSNDHGCASDTPSVNTWVFPYLGWIQRVTEDKFCIK